MIGTPTLIQPASPLLIEVEGLTVQFDRRIRLSDLARGRPRAVATAVDHLSLIVSKGELLALVGESGCGKTTTASAILGLQTVRSGRVRVLGVDIGRASRKALNGIRRRVLMIFQDPYESLDPRQRVSAILEEPLLIHKVGKSKVERQYKIQAALERVDLIPADAYVNRYPHELSGGQRQRVAIAAALVLDPDVLITDEPVSMLDVSARAGILNLIDRLREQGLGVLMITHDLSTAKAYADRIAVMYLGRIVEEGLAEDVLGNPLHPYTKALVAAVPSRLRRNLPQGGIAGEIADPAHIPPGCRFHPRCPIAIARCERDDPQLLVRGAHLVACHLAGAPVPGVNGATGTR